MGQATLKTEQPVHYAGPRGDKYYCRNRCGTVVWEKGTNEAFIERANRPLWGWCEQCRQAAIAAIQAAQVAARAAQADAERAS